MFWRRPDFERVTICESTAQERMRSFWPQRPLPTEARSEGQRVLTATSSPGFYCITDQRSRPEGMISKWNSSERPVRIAPLKSGNELGVSNVQHRPPHGTTPSPPTIRIFGASIPLTCVLCGNPKEAESCPTIRIPLQRRRRWAPRIATADGRSTVPRLPVGRAPNRLHRADMKGRRRRRRPPGSRSSGTVWLARRTANIRSEWSWRRVRRSWTTSTDCWIRISEVKTVFLGVPVTTSILSTLTTTIWYVKVFAFLMQKKFY